MLAVKNSTSNSKINLPDNKIFIKSYNNAWIEENKKTKKYDIILKDIVELSNGYIVEIIKETESNSNYVTKINTQEINMPIHIRTRKEGDKLTLKGLNKEKKLKDIFIDEKVPIEKRKTWPVVTDDKDNIIWLPGLKKTKFDRAKTKNYDIIIRYRKKGSL